MWWRRLLKTAQASSVVPLHVGRSPLVLYTDAEGNGGIGMVLSQDPSHVLWTSTRAVPAFLELLLPRRTQIHALELVALPLALRQWEALCRGRDVICFIDNASALGALRKGSSSAADLNALAFTTLALAASMTSSLFLHWVPSALNIADPPSRGTPPPLGERADFGASWADLIISFKPLI